MDRTNERTLLARIRGRVQGVGFRAWTEDQARALGIDGWVRNEADGTVTAALGGEPKAVETMVGRLRRGPPGASVTGVETEDGAGGPFPSGFEIRR